MDGLDRDRVRLEADHPAWRAAYAAELDRLEAAVGDRVRRFEHVGSTAVPGVPAKPVVDVLALVADLEVGASLVDPLADLGYEHRSADEDRHFYARGPETARTHYLHVAPAGSQYAAEMVAFRDYLRAHPDVATEYAELKRTLADEHPQNREAYTEGKAAFVERVLADALPDRVS